MVTASKTTLFSPALASVLAALVVACSGSSDDAGADSVLIPTPDGGDGDARADAISTDACIDMPTSPACLDEATALFVSPTGNDQDPAAGTRKAPLKTINGALGKIDATRRRIYVCEGAYFEDLSLNATHSRLSIFGGIDCAWNSAPAIKPVIGASANPLKIDGTAALAIADIAVVAKDAQTGSSIAAFVSGGDTTFKRVQLTAGKGGSGDDGVTTPFTYPLQAALDGNGATDGVGGKKGGLAKDLACPGGLMSEAEAEAIPGIQARLVSRRRAEAQAEHWPTAS
jgi:hypothetical protein